MGLLQSAKISQRHYTLLDLASTFRDLNSTDPKVKLYAFRGLASDENLTPLPNYSESIEDVYIQFATYFVSHGQGMQLLCEAGALRSTKTWNLPSWVVDWSFNENAHIMNYNKGAMQIPLSHGPTICHYSRSKVELTPQPNVVSVCGAIRDKVVFLTSEVPHSRDDDTSKENTFSTIRHLFDEAKKLVHECTKVRERYTSSLEHAFQRTLIGDEAFEIAQDHLECSKLLNEPDFLGSRQQDSDNVESLTSSLQTTTTTTTTTTAAVKDFYLVLEDHLTNRRFCVTQHRYIGLAPGLTKTNDLVAIFQGARAPFILRRPAHREPQALHMLIGDVYVHGMMQGKGIETLDLQFEDILIE